MDELQNIFVGERLKELRILKGRTQSDIAKYFGITKQAVSKWETGHDLYPGSWTFFKRDSVISGIELDS